MSYKALYRKYRPQEFNEVIGQDHIISTLNNIVKMDKISHAYLFAGPRGTGKTSVAHIFANKINEIDVNEKNYENNFDIIEIDAASNNGVAEIRKLIDNANYLPTKYRYKVYIIDEVHMLTKGAFNALLKTLEEPSAHLVFILATTEPQKIPTTILSRTQRFNFKRIDSKLMIKNLQIILQKEQISFEEEAIKLIANLSQGGMRDCLSIADQAASYGNNKISFAAISQVFGIISIENQIKIINLAYERKTKDLLIQIDNFINNGADIERLINSLINVVKDFIIYEKTNDIELCLTLSLAEMNLLKINIDFAYKVISELIDSIKYIKFSEMKRQIFEISFLKLSSIEESDEKSTTKIIKNNDVDPIVKTEFIKQNKMETKPSEQINLKEDKTVIKDNEYNVDLKEDIKPVIEKTSSVSNLNNKFDEIKIEESDEKFATKTIKNSDVDPIVKTEFIKQNKMETKPSEQINLKEDKTVIKDNEYNVDLKEDIQPVIEKTSSIFNLNNKFDEIKIEESDEKENFTNKELINYLQYADKNKIAKFKSAFLNVINWTDKVKNKNYITFLQNLKIISGGYNFIIVSSNDNYLINSLKKEVHKKEFINLVSKILEEPVKMIVISRKEFDELKKEWKWLVSTNSLPPKYKIETIKLDEKNKSNIEQYGEKIFGKLFESKEE